MNKLFKTTRNGFLGEAAVISELVKSQHQEQCDLTITNPSHFIVRTSQHATYSSSQMPGHLKISVLMVISALLLTTLGGTAQAGETITYDNEPDKLATDPFNNTNSFSPSPSSLTDNRVTVINGFIPGNVNGGATMGNGEVSNNSVTITGGKVDGYVFGGNSKSGNATGNSVTISGGKVNWNIFGGSSTYGNATGNSVSISGGEMRRSVTGGGSYFGNATGNSLTITGGEVGYTVYGGSSMTASASGNSVIISAGKVSGEVIGGYSVSGSATDNTVTISGTPLFDSTNTSLYGGVQISGTGDAFTGNTLYFSAHPVTVNNIANFEHYNFTIDPAHANTSTALITAESITLGNGSGTPSTVAVVGIHSGNTLSTGDKFTLMQAINSMSGDSVGLTTTGIAQQGISLLYDIRTDVDLTGNQVTATILAPTSDENRNDGGGNGAGGEGNGGGEIGHGGGDESNSSTPAARVNPQLKALSEGYLAGAMLVSRGADAIAYNAFNTINSQSNQTGFTPFIQFSGSHTRYDSGSHIKSDDFLLTSGLAWRQNNLTAGVFLEAGWGNYDSYNSFYNAANVHGDGNSRYFGAGLLGRYAFDTGLYTEASMRFGRNRNKFDTNDIQNLATGEFAKYTVTSSYVSAHIGAGYLLPLNEQNQLDLSAKYLWTRLDGKDVSVAGDNIHFDRIDSRRARLNATLKHQYSEAVNLNAGLGYEYEFDGKAKATTYGVYTIDAPSVKGGTGILSLGASIKPIANRNLKLDFKLNGYTGKREGVGASIWVDYAF